MIRTAGLILAAGASRRLPPGNKVLRTVRGRPLLHWPVVTARAAGLAPVIVVVGHEAEAVARAAAEAGARPVEAPRWERGPAASLAAGIRAVVDSGDVHAAVVLLGDEPWISSAVVNRIVRRWRRGRASLWRVRYRDRPGHPVLVDASLFGLASRPARGSAWDALGGPQRGREMRVRRRAPRDVDRPADLAAARRREAGSPR